MNKRHSLLVVSGTALQPAPRLRPNSESGALSRHGDTRRSDGKARVWSRVLADAESPRGISFTRRTSRCRVRNGKSGAAVAAAWPSHWVSRECSIWFEAALERQLWGRWPTDRSWPVSDVDWPAPVAPDRKFPTVRYQASQFRRDLHAHARFSS